MGFRRRVKNGPALPRLGRLDGRQFRGKDQQSSFLVAEKQMFSAALTDSILEFLLNKSCASNLPSCG